MISDKELFKQMLERDFMNLYNMLPSIASNFGLNISPYLPLFKNKILGYADIAVSTITDALFGSEESDIDEATDIAKMMVTDKIEEYRKKSKRYEKIIYKFYKY